MINYINDSTHLYFTQLNHSDILSFFKLYKFQNNYCFTIKTFLKNQISVKGDLYRINKAGCSKQV